MAVVAVAAPTALLELLCFNLIYCKSRNIGVQIIWQFHHNLAITKYWRIFNLAILRPISMALCVHQNIGGF